MHRLTFHSVVLAHAHRHTTNTYTHARTHAHTLSHPYTQMCRTYDPTKLVLDFKWEFGTRSRAVLWLFSQVMLTECCRVHVIIREMHMYKAWCYLETEEFFKCYNCSPSDMKPLYRKHYGRLRYHIFTNEHRFSRIPICSARTATNKCSQKLQVHENVKP